MNNLYLNLFTDTFAYAEESDYDAKVTIDFAIDMYLSFRKEAILSVYDLNSAFPAEIHARHRYHQISSILYKRLSHTVVALHTQPNMPDLSEMALTCEFFESSTWKPILAKACIQAMYNQEFCVGVKQLYHDDILITLVSERNDLGTCVHIYFNEQAKKIYDEHHKSTVSITITL